MTEDQPVQYVPLRDLDFLIAPDHPIRQVKVKVDELLHRMESQLEEIQAKENPAIQPKQVLKARILQALYSLNNPHLFCLRIETDILFRWFLDMDLSKSGFRPVLFEKCQDQILKHPETDIFFSEVACLVESQGRSSHVRFQVDHKLIESWATLKGYRPRPYTPKKVAIYMAIFLFLGTYYYWHCAREVGDPWHFFNIFSAARYGAYGDLARAFVSGHVSLLIEPDSKLAQVKDPYDPAQLLPGTQVSWDYSYYHGKYYLYFGPVPALLIGCPWYFATSYFPSENLLVFIFCILNLIFFFCLIRSLISNYFHRAPLWMECLIYIVYGLTNLLAYVLGRPIMYEVAIVSGEAFTLGFFLFMLLAINRNSTRWFWMMLASCSAGLSTGCRPTTIFLFVFLGLYWLYLHRKPRWSTTLIKETLAIFLPALLSISALLWYNYVRFDDPFSFGVGFVLNSGDAHFHTNFQLKNIPDGIWSYYFMPWRFDPAFPYVEMVSGLHVPGIYLADRARQVYTGLLPSFPIDILGFLWPFYIFKFRATEKNPLIIFGLMISGWALFIGVIVSAFFATVARYELELQWPLLLLAFITLLARTHLGPLLLWQRYVLALLLFVSCYMGIAYGFTSEEYWIQDVMRRIQMSAHP